MKSTKIFLLLLAIIVASLDAVAGGRYFSEFNDLSEWSTDRYAPNLFEQATFQNDARLHLLITDDWADRESSSQTTHKNTHGRKFLTDIPITANDAAVIKGKLYIPQDWQTNHRRSDLWSLTYDASDAKTDNYPIIGFANTEGTNPTFRVWTHADAWANLSTTITYDQWYELEMRLYPQQSEFYINGNLVYTDNVATSIPAAASVGYIWVQGYNFGDLTLPAAEQVFNDDYDIYWDDIAVHSATDRVYNITQTTTHENIQPAVNAATAGDYLRVLEGTFVQTNTLSINKALTIIGDSEAGCFIDVSAVNGPAYGIKVGASDVTIKNFTTIPNTANGSYLFKVSDDIANITLENITANASKKTPFDFHAVTNLTLTNLTATNTVGGNAISLTGCNNVTITGVTSSNNAWGGIAVYCSKPTYYNRASNNVNFDFAANNVEDAVYIQNEFGFVSTNINISNWTYETANTPLTEYTFYTDGDLLEAYGFATYLNTRLGNTASVVKDNNSVYHVMPLLSIQAAIDAAAPGNTILVEAGDYGMIAATGRMVFGTHGPANGYQFGMFIDKDNLKIRGLDVNGNVVTDPANAAVTFTTNATNSFGSSGIFVQANGVTLEGLKIGDNFKNGVMDNNKTIEVVGNNFTISNCYFNTVANQGSLYFGEWDLTHPITHYTINNNIFHNALVSINNGVGKTGDVANRQITNNTFTGEREYYLISFRGWNGENPVQGWIVKPVGGAVITGNDFSGVTNVDDYINARGNVGGVIAGQLDWAQIWNQNTFGNKVIALSDYANFVPADLMLGTYPNSVRINTNLQDNIALTPAGSTILLGDGTFLESGQFVIDKNLAIKGAGKDLTVINTDYATTNSSYTQSAAWFYVAPDATFGMSNLTIDGQTNTINTAIQSRGESNIDNCVIKNIKSGTYYGFGVQFLTGDNNSVTNCEFSDIQRVGIHVRGGKMPNAPTATIENCTYQGKATVDALDYAIEFGGGGKGTVTNCTIDGNSAVASTDGSTSAGILVTTYFGAGTEATITGTTITGCTTGIAVGYDANDVSDVTVSGCTFTNNNYAITSTAPEVDATGCNYFSTDLESEVKALLNGDINYIPFMLASGNCDGGKHVHNVTQNIDYWTIQEAINDANANDMIEVEAGDYDEFLTIDKSLTLLGPNAILSPNTDTRGAEANLKPVSTTSTQPIIKCTAPNITVIVKGFTFDLVDSKPHNDETGDYNVSRFVEILGKANVDFTFEHNIFQNGYSVINGNWYVSGNNGDLNLDIIDNYFHNNWCSNGITVWSTGTNYVDVIDNVFELNEAWSVNFNRVHGDFIGNTVKNDREGAVEWWQKQGGFIIAASNNDVKMSNNTFENIGIAGIYLYDNFTGTMNVNNNTFTNCGSDAIKFRVSEKKEADLSNVTVVNNSFSGTGEYAINNLTTQQFSAINNWWGDCSGPEVASNIGGVGDKLTDNVDYYPWTQGDCSGYNIMVKLIDSKNNPIPDQVAQIRNGSYIAANTNQFGYITANIPQYYTYVKMTHLGKTETKLGVFNRDPIVIYQTKEVTVNFKDSYGNDLIADELLYRDGTGALIPMATNASTASIEMLPLSFDFQAKYLGFAQTVTQNVKNAQTVDFGTIAVNLSLKDSDGNPLAAEDLAYRNVEGNYVSIAQNADNHTLEMLPLSYYFQATYLGFGQPLFQNTADDATIEFQTKPVIVSLANSTGNPLEAEELYYRDANYNYVSLGTNISADTLEMLPLSYYFKAKYLGYTQTKQQNVTNNQAVNFQTVLVSFNLVDGSNTPLNGTAIYRNGYASYVSFGLTGQTPETMEMLPLYYYFRCTYNGKTKTKLWNVNNNPNVLFTYDGSKLFKEAEAGEEFVSDWSGITTKSYPTPFSTVLNIEYTTTEDTDVTIEIFDVAGRKVRTLESSFVSNGKHATTWDGTSDSGNILESGTYYYVIIAGENTQTGIISFVK